MKCKPLLLNIRGTCGSGKSHIVHTIRREVTPKPMFETWRRRPVGYETDRLFIAGHYEIAIGGIDTFKSLDVAYTVIDRCSKGRNVLCEGKAQNRDVDYLIGRQFKFKVICINLTTPPEEAVASVRSRGHNISEQIIHRTFRKCQRDVELLQRAGVEVHSLNRLDAMTMVGDLLA